MQLGCVYFDEQDPKSKIGTGTFGSVFKARLKIGTSKKTKEEEEEEKAEEQQVAIKKILKCDAKVEELKTIRSLDNCNILKIFDILYHQEHCFLVMELCDTSLSNLIEEEGSLSVENFQTVLQGLAKGYKALSEVNIIHRDLKPANVLLNFRQEQEGNKRTVHGVKITDFGSSRLAESKLNTKLVGTPLYMAPEMGASVLSKGEYDLKVDMWSIGIMLYECITGTVPFDEKALCKLFLFAANQNYHGYTGPGELPPSTSEQHRYLIDSLLELDPNKRPTPTEFHCLAVHHPPIKHKASLAQKLSRQNATAVVDCKICSNQTDHSEPSHQPGSLNATLRHIFTIVAILLAIMIRTM